MEEFIIYLFTHDYFNITSLTVTVENSSANGGLEMPQQNAVTSAELSSRLIMSLIVQNFSLHPYSVADVSCRSIRCGEEVVGAERIEPLGTSCH